MEEREPIIKKAVLGGRQLTVVYTETYPEGEQDITVKSEIPAHKDCTDAFKKLVPHFILLTEMKESDRVGHLAARAGIENIPAEDEFKNAEVSGIKLGKNESDVPTVTLTGERYLRTGGSVVFCSPAQELESSGGEFEYPYVNELNLAVQAVVYEVKAYLFHHKYAITQTEIHFESVPEPPIEAGRMIDTDTGKVTPIRIAKRRPKAAGKSVAPSGADGLTASPLVVGREDGSTDCLADGSAASPLSSASDLLSGTVAASNPKTKSRLVAGKADGSTLRGATPRGATSRAAATPVPAAVPAPAPVPASVPASAQKPKRGRRPKYEISATLPTC